MIYVFFEEAAAGKQVHAEYYARILQLPLYHKIIKIPNQVLILDSLITDKERVKIFQYLEEVDQVLPVLVKPNWIQHMIQYIMKYKRIKLIKHKPITHGYLKIWT